jgi:hypothetical protein
MIIIKNNAVPIGQLYVFLSVEIGTTVYPKGWIAKKSQCS